MKRPLAIAAQVVDHPEAEIAQAPSVVAGQRMEGVRAENATPPRPPTVDLRYPPRSRKFVAPSSATRRSPATTHCRLRQGTLTRNLGAITKLWDSAWEEFIPFLDYDVEIRTVMCSTNEIESLNARDRRHEPFDPIGVADNHARQAGVAPPSNAGNIAVWGTGCSTLVRPVLSWAGT